MLANEIIAKAKALDEKYDCVGVIALLKDYVAENSADKTAFALYEKNLTFKAIVDQGLSFEKLYSEDFSARYSDIPNAAVLPLSEVLFRNNMADTYLRETEKEQLEHSYAYLKVSILTLGDRLEEYSVLETVLDTFSKIMAQYGLQKYFYDHLAIIVDWKSKVSENILHYLVKKANTLSSCTPEKQLYDNYIKGWKGNIIPFADKPQLRGGKLVITNIKTEEAKDFWKGYFAYVKQVRTEEYEAYKKIIADENHILYGADRIDEKIRKAWMSGCNQGILTTEDVAKMQVATGCGMIKADASAFQGRIEAAKNSYDTVKVNPIAQIKLFVMKLLGKE